MADKDSTPQEKARAIRWARILLEMLATDEFADADWQLRAQDVLYHYPNFEELTAIAEKSYPVLAPEDPSFVAIEMQEITSGNHV